VDPEERARQEEEQWLLASLFALVNTSSRVVTQRQIDLALGVPPRE
jgi:hypothetical protein